MKFPIKSKALAGGGCIALAAVLSFAVLPRISNQRAQLTDVLQLTGDVSAGTILEDSMLQTVTVGAYGLPEAYDLDRASVLGKVVTEDLYAGEYLSSGRIADADSADADAVTSPLLESECYLTIELPDAAAGVAGTLRAGDTVNVFSASGGSDAELVLERLSVADVLNASLQSLSELDSKASLATDDTTYDLKPVYVLFRCDLSEACSLLRLEEDGSLRLALVGDDT